MVQDKLFNLISWFFLSAYSEFEASNKSGTNLRRSNEKQKVAESIASFLS